MRRIEFQRQGKRQVLKRIQRGRGYRARQNQPDKERSSALICRRFVELPQYRSARTIMWYVHCRSEVRTLSALAAALETKKRCVIPYCTVDGKGRKRLGLWLLKQLGELQPGTWGIPEPPRDRWNDPARHVEPEQLDLVMVPGVAFDRRGGRIGNGAGYYDRLLAAVRDDACLAGVAYQAQVFDRVKTSRHDVLMNKVITERNVYPGERK